MRATLAAFTKNMDVTDLRWMDEKFTVGRLSIELLSGLTVALALVPEAVAFAFVAGVNPLVGLYAAFIVGLITALFGGRPGMISGATGALAVVMVALVAQHGLEYLLATVVLMGLLQIFAGVMQWGKFIRLVPHPVMLGFVNGLAIVIFSGPNDPVQGAGHGCKQRSRYDGWRMAVRWAALYDVGAGDLHDGDHLGDAAYYQVHSGPVGGHWDRGGRGYWLWSGRAARW